MKTICNPRAAAAATAWSDGACSGPSSAGPGSEQREPSPKDNFLISDGGMMRLETLIELKFLNSSC